MKSPAVLALATLLLASDRQTEQHYVEVRKEKTP